MRHLISTAGIFLFLFALGAGIRLFDLTDQPIDFHPTRQLRSAIIARGMYYEMLPGADPELREQAASFWSSTGQYEPSILERIVALGYILLGGELPWLGRLLNILFWVFGGVFLFDLARRMTGAGSGLSGTVAALTALAYYLVLPFSVQASRAFQPDPGMTVWIIVAAWAAYRWSETSGLEQGGSCWYLSRDGHPDEGGSFLYDCWDAAGSHLLYISAGKTAL